MKAFILLLLPFAISLSAADFETRQLAFDGKAMFVASNRTIAYDLYKEVIALRPEWAEVKVCADGEELTEQEQKQIIDYFADITDPDPVVKKYDYRCGICGKHKDNFLIL